MTTEVMPARMDEQQKLTDKVAIITGATSGIGARTAELFVEEGARVLFTGRRKPEGEAVQKKLGKAARFEQADATVEADWQRIIAQALVSFGRLDCLFNNAGGPAPTGSITGIPVEGFDAAMALLVRSVMLGMKHAAPVMMRQRSGSIINNGSIAAHLAGYSSSMVYSAAKAAVNHLSRCVAMELGEHNVRVNSVSPGQIATGILGKALGLGADDLADLALGSVAHDLGKARIPGHLLKARTRAKHEEDFYRAHVSYGLELARESGVFTPGALAIVGEHHEFIDGSGFPRGSVKPGLLPQIVGLVNRYDRLCGPESPERTALMPSEALSAMFSGEATKFDQKLLGLLIKVLGVYPPGTIVVLNDGSLGLVVSPGRESLRPEVLIYDPGVSKADAVVVDLSEALDLKIEESVRPSTLPSDVLLWLNPRQRLSHFFSTKSAAD